MRPMLGDLELETVQRIETEEGQVLTRHEVPALEGDFLQRLGRRGSRVALAGVVAGPGSRERLQELRSKLRAAEPVSFLSDVATATRLAEVILEELEFRELAGRPERYEVALALRELTEPPAAESDAEELPATEEAREVNREVEQGAGEPSPDEQIDGDLGNLVVEVLAEGEEDLDFEEVTVNLSGTQQDGATRSQMLTRSEGNRWTEGGLAAGTYTVEAVAGRSDSGVGSAQVTVSPGETTGARITLEVGRLVAAAFVVHFRFDKAFLEPSMRAVLRHVAAYARAHPQHRLLVVGHTDLSGSEAYNQSLSERRARCVYAHLIAGRDPAAALVELDQLRRRSTPGILPSLHDTWGTRQYQHVLQDLRYYPGNVDGLHGSHTDSAVRSFQHDHNIAATGAVEDETWRAMLGDYLAQDALDVPESQFFPNGDTEIVKWLGCGEQAPVRNTRDAWRPNRRTEVLFVRADALPCEVPRPDTFDLPSPGVVGSSWNLGPGDPAERCCFATRDPGERDQWLIVPAEPETLLVKGVIRFEDRTPLVGASYALIAPDGEFLDGERPAGPRGGEPILGRTGEDGSFLYPNRPRGVRVYTLELEGPYLARLAGEPSAAAKGNVLGMQVEQEAATSDFDIIVTSADGVAALREVVVRTEDPDEPLTEVWVYWRQDGHSLLLRTDTTGLLRMLRPEGDPSAPQDYRDRFTAQPGSEVEVFYSRGARPIPIPVLTAGGDPFHRRVVTAPTTPGQPAPAPSAPAQVAVPAVLAAVTHPADLSIWPLLRELPTDAYHTDGLRQGVNLWNAGGMTEAQAGVFENDPAPAPSAAVRPRERFLRVEGTIDASATGVTLEVLDASGSVADLRPSHGAAVVQQVQATVGAAAGATAPFEGSILFTDAPSVFGPVEVVARSVGITPPLIFNTSPDLYGFQTALVDDPGATQRGPLLGEADERVQVDFLASPQGPPLANISNQTRARRMVPYRIRAAQRPLDPSQAAGPTNPNVVQPQMPMWMAELHLAGLTLQRLTDLMSRVYARRHGTTPGQTVTLTLDLHWGLLLSWDGPDSNSPAFPPADISRPNQFHDYVHLFLDDQRVVLHFDQQGQLVTSGGQPVQLGAGGEIPGAFDPPTQQLDQPVSGRRLPQVIVGGQQRPWGRHAGAVPMDAFLVEHQTTHFVEPDFIRGGDGVLDLSNTSIDGQTIDQGLVPGPGGTPQAPPADQPDLRVPAFRVRGENPEGNDVDTLIDAVVQEFFNANAADPHVALLTLAIWQVTARLIIDHESVGGRHFDSRGAGRRRFQRRQAPPASTLLRYGHEDGMPIFGAPHGYGFGQLDLIFGRGPNPDEVWSFLENIRAAVEVIMREKAQAAFNHLTTPAGSASATAFNGLALRRRRAIFRREVVRRYNGFLEFQFEGGQWVIHTTSNRREYPNNVLGTNVAYPGPTPFAVGDFGPGI